MEELYDHKKDPYEWKNIATSKKGILNKMRQEMKTMVQPYQLVGFQKI